MVACAYTPSSEEQERGGSQHWLTSLSRSLSEFWANERACFKIQNEWYLRNDSQDWHLASTHMFTPMDTYAYEHAHKCTKDNCNRKRVITAVGKGISNTKNVCASMGRESVTVWETSSESHLLVLRSVQEYGFPLRSVGSQEGLVAMGCIGCQWLRVGISFRSCGDRGGDCILLCHT